MENISPHIFLVCLQMDYRTMTSGDWQGALYFRRYGRGLLVSKTMISFEKKWWGHRRTTHYESVHQESLSFYSKFSFWIEKVYSSLLKWLGASEQK